MFRIYRKIAIGIVISFVAFNFIKCSVPEKKMSGSSYEKLREGFINPTGDARPKVYWWCLNGNIDTIRAKQELLAMKEAGIGGFDLFEIGVPKEDTMIPGGPSFLSDESLGIIKYVIDEAGELGLTVGLNLASSWNAGGSWTKPKHGGKSLYVSTTKVNGNSSIQKIAVPFPEVKFPKESLIGGTDKPMIPFQDNGRPEYYEEVTILAIPSNTAKHTLDTAQIIDVSNFFDTESDALEWEAPPGEWDIRRYICSNSGQQLVLPSPSSAGLTIDHFDAEAVETHLMYVIERLQSVLGDFSKTALKSFYLASYEARGFVWTSTLVSEFKKINGYNINKLIPSLFDAGVFSEEMTQKTQQDFRKTLSKLMINNLYENSREICHRYGLKINCEAGGPGYPLYNGPAEPLKALGALDIPRGEFWINHARYYEDSETNANIDILQVVKEVAAASHIYHKGIVEEEAFTSFQHWQEGPFDMKPYGDRAFCEGMNRVVFHGFSHNISGSGFPGYVYHAGTHFNDKRVWWTKAKPFIQYLSRLSYIFQEADFVADVVWYYGDKVPNSATPKNTHFTVGAGYDYEVINTEILLNDLSVKDGKLALSDGSTFSVLALENEENINPRVLLKIEQLVEQGAMVVGEKPQNIAIIKNSPITPKQGKNLIDQIWTNSNNSLVNENGKGNIQSDIAPLELLTSIQLGPDFSYADKDLFLLDFIHYQKNGFHFYFISNTSNEWISRECGFRQGNSVPEIWDPTTGEIIAIPVYQQKGAYLQIPLTFPPFGSQMIVLKPENGESTYQSILDNNHEIPHLEYDSDSLILLEEGSFTLVSEKGSIMVNNKINTQLIEGDWKLFFPEGWGAPEINLLPKLVSWTESEIPGVRYFSGTATYRKTFNYRIDTDFNNSRQIYLDLGELSKVGEVWLNDTHLGIAWSKPYKFDVTNIIKEGDNELIVEISNTWSNRLTGDATSGEKYTNSNISNTIVPTSGMLIGDQTRVPWKDVPLIESGLLGPVRILTYNKWHLRD